MTAMVGQSCMNMNFLMSWILRQATTGTRKTKRQSCNHSAYQRKAAYEPSHEGRMSFRLVDLLFDVPRLTVTEHLILSAICRAASNDDYTCFPSKAWIAEKSRQSSRQVRRILPQLVEKGYTTMLTKGHGKGNTSHVQVNAAYLKALASKGATQSPIEVNEEAEPSQPKEDAQSPYIDTPELTYAEQKETTAYPKGDNAVGQKETPETPKGDNRVPYIGRIGQCNR
jgi:Helix-turn-helix domain